jgi:prolyl 4-hydroxylase
MQIQLPEPNLIGSPNKIFAHDREITVVFSMQLPRIVLFENLLSLDECNTLIQEAEPRLQVSKVMGETGGEHILHPARISAGMFFRFNETPMITNIEQRISALLNWPMDHAEAFQILHYNVDGKYDPHYDYFRLDSQSTPAAIAHGGQRVGTLIIYLRSPEKGGGTIFPDIGLEIVPLTGSAVFFSYDKPDPSTKTLHGGLPVIEGEKWIATKWLRETKFS